MVMATADGQQQFWDLNFDCLGIAMRLSPCTKVQPCPALVFTSSLLHLTSATLHLITTLPKYIHLNTSTILLVCFL